MIHECPNCGQECYCDIDDTGGLPIPDDCPHASGKACELGNEDEYEDVTENRQ